MPMACGSFNALSLVEWNDEYISNKLFNFHSNYDVKPHNPSCTKKKNSLFNDKNYNYLLVIFVNHD